MRTIHPAALLLLALALPAGAQTVGVPPSQPPSPEAAPAAPDPVATPAEQVDCKDVNLNDPKMKADDRKRLKEVCAKASKTLPAPAPDAKPPSH